MHRASSALGFRTGVRSVVFAWLDLLRMESSGSKARRAGRFLGVAEGGLARAARSKRAAGSQFLICARGPRGYPGSKKSTPKIAMDPKRLRCTPNGVPGGAVEVLRALPLLCLCPPCPYCLLPLPRELPGASGTSARRQCQCVISHLRQSRRPEAQAQAQASSGQWPGCQLPAGPQARGQTTEATAAGNRHWQLVAALESGIMAGLLVADNSPSTSTREHPTATQSDVGRRQQLL
jgi:hypothetical protein